MTTRATLHELIDSLPEELLPEAEDSLGRLAADRGHASEVRLEDAPLDSEPLTEREKAALRRYDRGERTGRVYSEAELIALIESTSSG